MSAVAENLKRVRRLRGVSQDALAKQLFVTRQAISNWENGKTQPDLDMLEKIAHALDVDMTELIYAQRGGQAFLNRRKQRVLVTVVLLILLAVLIMAGPPLLEIRRSFSRRYYVPPWFLMIYFWRNFLVYGVAELCIVSFIYIWKDIRLLSKNARIAALVVGVLSMGYFIIIQTVGLLLRWDLPPEVTYWCINHPATFVVPSLSIYLSVISLNLKAHGNRRKRI